jgi:hypothetical protein
MQAFEHFGGAPREILYDRMKTAVLGEPEDDSPIVYNAKLVALGAHYGFTPRACQPYRAKTKGKVERPYRYIRADFFMARRFANLEDMNRQLRLWLDTVANARLHGTTGRIVAEHLGEERPSLQRLPAGRFDAVLRIERRVSHEGLGGRQPVQRARRHPPSRAGGRDHRHRGAHPRGPTTHCRACPAAWAWPAFAAAGA